MSQHEEKIKQIKYITMTQIAYMFVTMIITIAVCLVFIKILFPEKKIAYIDTARLMVGFSEANIIEKEIKTEDDKWQKQYKEIQDSVQASMNIMSKEYDNASNARKKELQDILSARNQQMNNFKQAKIRQIETLRQEKMKGIVEKINVYVSEYGKKNKYDIIFGTASGNIVYANQNAMDITENIIKGLNERYK